MRFAATPLTDVVQEPRPRAEHSSLASELRPAFLARDAGERGLDRLFEPGALAVTTGQQPGLFTGPLYTIYKALSAAALARRLEPEFGRPVVPVFWLANDDHDHAEAREVGWLDLEGGLVRVGLAERSPEAPLTPMYRERLGSEVGDLLERFERDHPLGSHRDEVVAWLRKHYREGATVGSAFGGAMAELLGRFGIVCFDATHPAAKRAMAPLVLRVLREAGTIYERLATNRDVLLERGHTTSVVVTYGNTLAFLEDEAGRDRLVVDGDGFATRRTGTVYQFGDLEDIAAREPTRLSPNVLLRPVVESALLPTVSYVAGPGELSYLPLAAPLYAHLEVSPQAPVPRWSGIAVEPRVDRVLRKFDASLTELVTPGNELERRVVRAKMPARLLEGVAQLRRALDEDYRTVQEGAVDVDPTLERLVGAAQGRAKADLDRVERKAEQHLRRRESIELAQIARARTGVHPGDAPQERVLGVAGFLARYGPRFLDDAYEEIDAWYGATLVSGPSTS